MRSLIIAVVCLTVLSAVPSIVSAEQRQFKLMIGPITEEERTEIEISL